MASTSASASARIRVISHFSAEAKVPGAGDLGIRWTQSKARKVLYTLAGFKSKVLLLSKGRPCPNRPPDPHPA